MTENNIWQLRKTFVVGILVDLPLIGIMFVVPGLWHGAALFFILLIILDLVFIKDLRKLTSKHPWIPRYNLYLFTIIIVVVNVRLIFDTAWLPVTVFFLFYYLLQDAYWNEIKKLRKE